MIIALFISLIQIANFQEANFMLYCDKDIVLQNGENYIPTIYDQNSPNNFSFRDQPEYLELLDTFKINRQNIIYSSLTNQHLIIMNKYGNRYSLEKFNLIFHFTENQIMNYTLAQVYETDLEIGQCANIIFVDLLFSNISIICEYDDQYIVYMLYQEKKDSPIIIQNSYNLRILEQCTFSIYSHQYQQILILSFDNCKTWIIYKCDIERIQVLAESNNFNNQILRHIEYSNVIIMQFDHLIINVYSNITLYENKYQKILNFKQYDEQFVIVVEKTNNDVVDDLQSKNLILYRIQNPQKIIKTFHFIILQFDTYLEYINPFSISYFLQLKMNQRTSLFCNNPLLILINEFHELHVIKINQHSNYLICNEYESQNQISLIENMFHRDLKILTGQIIHKKTYEQEFINNSYNIQISLLQNQFYFSLYTGLFSKLKLTPDLIFLNNSSKIQCNLIKYTILSRSCIDLIKNYLWIKEFVVYYQLHVLYQQENLELMLMNCVTNKSFAVGKFEALKIEEPQFYIFKTQIFIPYEDGTKVLCLEIRNGASSISPKIIKIQGRLKKILCYKNMYIIITKAYQMFLYQNKLMAVSTKDIAELGIISVYQCENFEIFFGVIKACSFNQTIIINTQIFTVQFNLDTQILSIIQIKSTYNSYILIEKTKKEQINVNKYELIGNQKILLFTLPKFRFEYQIPIKYVTAGNFLAIAATSNNTKVILIYYLINDYHDILIDIIIVDGFYFHFCSDNSLAILSNQQWKIYDLQSLDLNCKIEEKFVENSKIFNYELQQISKINQKDQKKITLNLELINLTGNIIQSKSSVATFRFNNTKQKIVFDPQILVAGPIYNITSSNAAIKPPLQNIRNITKTQCAELIQTICYNTENNEIFLDLLNNTIYKYIGQKHLEAFKSEEYYIIAYFSGDFVQNFEIYKQNEGLIIKTNIQQQFRMKYDWITIFSNYCLIQQNEQLHVYVIQSDQLIKIDTLEFQCRDCETIKVKNSNNTIMISSSVNAHFSFESFVILQIIKNKVYLHQFNKVEEEFLLQELKNIELIRFYNLSSIQDNQLSGKIVAFQLHQQIYVLDIVLNLELNQLKISRQIGTVSYFGITYVNQIFILESYLMLISSDYSQYTLLLLYNLSDFSVCNSKYPIQTVHIDQFPQIQFYNLTHFFITFKMSDQIQLFQISEYSLEIQNTSNKYANLLFKNSEQSLEFQAELIQISNQSLFSICQKYIFYLILLSCLIFCYLSKRKKKQRHEIENHSEIEL
ncbi:unnamed protein product [Paramecium octaurelia]|uniref:Transmembrane protein n=1 Tax=Paramecium octaurelia TaxID=43137 RepID=A0A8S1XNT2_PAROT|nr:unnamed protein product [Paramecium octaurelia]